MSNIHETAIIKEGAKIGNNVNIGPFCVIGNEVIIHDNVELKAHVCIDGLTEIGDNTVIYPFASIGYPPQDLKYKGERSCVKIGHNNIIREYVTIQPGTEGGRMETTVGNNCLLMASAHVAHDCIVGDNVIIANNGTLAGHVVLGDYVILGGLSAIHQFVRIGAHVMIGGMTGVPKDVVPYALISGNRGELSGINIIGLKRRGFSRDEIADIQSAYNILFDNKDNLPFTSRIELLEAKFTNNETVSPIISFLKMDSKRQFCV